MANLERPAPSADWALLLDLDGTLIDIARSPMQVRVEPGLVPLLQRLGGLLNGAVGVVTGRQIEQVEVLLAPFFPPTAGVHGTQLRLSLANPIETLAPDVPEYLLRELRALFALMPGVTVEAKGAVVAIHYRLAPNERDRIEALLKTVVSASNCALVLSHGRMVFELVPRGFSKNSGVRALCALPAFEGRKPIMIGDDVSDEDGFTAAIQLGGMGLKVAGEHFPASDSQFSGPQDVRDWLAYVVDELECLRRKTPTIFETQRILAG
jgi:trehalose 6-phosphate phosphatase